LLLALREEPATVEREARLLLAIKLYELGNVSRGMAAQRAHLDRVTCLFELQRYSLLPIGTSPDELAGDVAHA
jgi:predicted HTH domain antitoxin